MRNKSNISSNEYDKKNVWFTAFGTIHVDTNPRTFTASSNALRQLILHNQVLQDTNEKILNQLNKKDD